MVLLLDFLHLDFQFVSLRYHVSASLVIFAIHVTRTAQFVIAQALLAQHLPVEREECRSLFRGEPSLCGDILLQFGVKLGRVELLRLLCMN